MTCFITTTVSSAGIRVLCTVNLDNMSAFKHLRDGVALVPDGMNSSPGG